MSFDVQFIRSTGGSDAARAREHAIFLEAQRAGSRAHKARNIADLLERGHKPSRGSVCMQGLIVDVKA